MVTSKMVDRENMLQVAKLMDVLPPDLIAAKMGIKQSTVEKYMAKILDGRVAAFKDKDYTQLIESSYHNYQRLKEEGWRLLFSAVETKDKATALEKIRQAQSAEDQLMKLAGIYKEVSVQISIEQMLQTPQFQQFQNGVLDFLSLKGIESEELFLFLERREKGEMDITITELVPSKGEDNSNIGDTPNDTYAIHRKEIIANRRSNKKCFLLGSHEGKRKRVRYEKDLKELGVTDYHKLKAKEMMGTLTEDEAFTLKQMEEAKDAPTAEGVSEPTSE